MSEEQNPSETSTPNTASGFNDDMPYDPRQRYLAKLSYSLACAGPFAFWVMAFLYPPTDERALPSLPIQILWWTLCLCSPCGAVLGAIALILFQKRTLGYRSLNANYAAPGLGVGVAASLALLLGIPALNDIRKTNHHDPARQVNCLSNVKQLGVAILMYVQDYDEQYPLPKTWNAEIYPYTKNEQILHCPDTRNVEPLPTYAMNGRLKALAAINEPDQTVVLFDSIPGKNLAGGQELFPDPLRHGEGRLTSIGYVDGHAKTVSMEKFSTLIWTPAATQKSAPLQTGQSESVPFLAPTNK